MSSKANKRLKGKGWFVPENGIIYVQGTVDGTFYRKSWKREHTPKNETYICKHHREVLISILNKEKGNIGSDFASFATHVIEDWVEDQTKKEGSTNLSKFRRLILPFFGKYKMKDIKATAHIEVFTKQMKKQGYSTSTIDKLYVMLRRVFRKAAADDIIMKNPMDFIDKVEKNSVKKQGYSVAEAVKMMTHSTGWIHAWLNVAFTTGLRPGEQGGLQWSNVNFEYECIFLNGAVSAGELIEGNSGKKNHVRIIPLLPNVVKILKAWKAESSSVFVFPNRNGTFYKESKSIIKTHFKPLLEELDIEYRELGVTRHTFSSVADNTATDEEITSAITGNSAKVREMHYSTVEITKERIAKAHAGLQGVNNVFFVEEKAEVK